MVTTPPSSAPIISPDQIDQWRTKGRSDSAIMSDVYNADPSFKQKVDSMQPFYQQQDRGWQSQFPSWSLNKYYKLNPEDAQNPPLRPPALGEPAKPGIFGSIYNSLLNPSNPESVVGYGVNIAKGVGSAVENAASGVNEAAANFHAGRQGFGSSALQATGAMAGGVSSALTEPIKPIVSNALQAGNELFIKPSPNIDKTVHAGLQWASTHWEDFSAQHPEAAANLKALGQTATLPLAMEGTTNIAKNAVENVGTIGEGAANAAGNVAEGIQNLPGKLPGAGFIQNTMADRQAFTNAQNIDPLVKLAMPPINPQEAAAEGRDLVTSKSTGQPMAGLPTTREQSIGETLGKIPQFQKEGFNPNTDLSAAAKTVEAARNNLFGPAVEQAAGDINFAFGQKELTGVLKDAMTASDQNIISGTEGVWDKTMQGFLKKFEAYSSDPDLDYTPSQAAWKAESDMMKTIPKSQMDAPTSAKALATKTFGNSIRDYLLQNADRMSSEAQAAGDTQAAESLQNFRQSLTDYRNIMTARENIAAKLPSKLASPPPSALDIGKGLGSDLPLVKSVVKVYKKAGF